MGIMIFYSGVLIGILVGWVLKSGVLLLYRRRNNVLQAQNEAMKETIILMMSRLKRLKKGVNTDRDDKIDIGIQKGIKHVLNERLSELEY